MSHDFVIPVDKVPLVESFRKKIQDLFQVDVSVAPVLRPVGTPTPTITKDADKSGEKWIRLTPVLGTSEDEMELDRAKDYISSLCASEEERVEHRCGYPMDTLKQLMLFADEIERNSQAVLSIDGNELRIFGRQLNVTLACSLVDQKLRLMPYLPSMLFCEDKDPGIVDVTAESRDSCYDSEDELDSTTSTHENVSRTVSDTLAAEYGDDTQSKSEAEQSTYQLDPEYACRVEKYLKLGYTESQLKQALEKLGSGASDNDLLNELIKLGHNFRPSEFEPQSSTSPIDSLMLMRRGSNSLQDDTSGLRHIVIDGSNVAMSHGNKEAFSCRGIQICVDWFKSRGHKEITVFVPKWRKESVRSDNLITDQEILSELERERILVFTPSRRIGSRRITSYDDRYVIKLAASSDGIIVSNDNYRDLANENPEFKKVIEERLLMYSFVNDRFMPPDDPLGRHGPTLDSFLQKERASQDPLPPLCPYGKKCTYGNKCKYYHPERGSQPQKTVTERLAEHAQKEMQEIIKTRGVKSRDLSPADALMKKPQLCRTRSGPPSLKSARFSTKDENSLGSDLQKLASKMATVSLSSQNLQSSTKETADRSLSLPAWMTTPQISISHSSTDLEEPPPIDTYSPWGNDSKGRRHSYDTSVLPPPFLMTGGDHLALAETLSAPSNSTREKELEGKKHKKLSRQPPVQSALDPRLYHVHNNQLAPPPLYSHGSWSSPTVPHARYEKRSSSIATSVSGGLDPRVLPPEIGYFPSATQTDAQASAYQQNVPQYMELFPPQRYSGDHQSVQRNLSDPDSVSQSRSRGFMTRQNSTSDPQLNICLDELHDPSVQDGSFRQNLHRSSFSFAGPNIWTPQQQLMPRSAAGHMALQASHSAPPVWERQYQVQSMHGPSSPWRSTPPQYQHHPLHCPTPQQQPYPWNIHPDEMPIDQGDPRYKVYFHLKSLFPDPDKRVELIMNRHSNVTSAQKLCSLILSMGSQHSEIL